MKIEKVKHLKEIGEAEKSYRDAQDTDSLALLHSYLDGDDKAKASRETRLAALNALRRLHCDSLVARSVQKEALTTYREKLCAFIKSGHPYLLAPSVKTMVEFTRLDNNKASSSKKKGNGLAFGVNSYTQLIRALLASEEDMVIELLLMLKNEIFDFVDCKFYAWVIISDTLSWAASNMHTGEKKVKSAIKNDTKSKSAGMSQVEVQKIARNAIDLLRVLTFEPQETIQEADYLVSTVSGKNKSGNKRRKNDDTVDSAEESDQERYDNSDTDEEQASSKKVSTHGKMKQGMVVGTKRKSFNKMTREEQMSDAESHKKVFSKAWTDLLALPLTLNQHKLVLKHLPDHVMPHLVNPLILGDYLTATYTHGGIVSVLALESLFSLIASHNFDYPDFFTSLYNLCTVEVFSARHKDKFMRLLSTCLKSTNLQAAVVAAFIKRLARLSLSVPAPSALYCVAQITWLLRNHPECMTLIHHSEMNAEDGEEKDGNVNSAAAPKVQPREKEEGGKSDGQALSMEELRALLVEKDSFNAHESDPETAQALSSSLWEAAGLQAHYLHSVSSFASSLETSHLSTMNSVNAPYLSLEDFMGYNYDKLIKAEFKTTGKKANVAMAFKEPKHLLPEGSATRALFG